MDYLNAKLSKLILFSTLFININVNSQELKGYIEYEASLKPIEVPMFELEKRKIKRETISKVKKILKNSSPVLFTLTFKGGESVFSKKNVLEKEGINFTNIISGKGVFYTNLKDKVLLHEKEFMNKPFLISYPLTKWNLTQEKKKIGSYVCFKALTKKEVSTKSGIKFIDVIAWYSPDLPINLGPKEFNNLPGLVLELEEGDMLKYRALKIDYNYDKEVILEVPHKGDRITLKEFDKTVKLMVKKHRNY